MRVFWILCCCALIAGAPGWAQESTEQPSPADTDDSDTGEDTENDEPADEEEEPTATLTFSTDGASNIYVDGVLKGVLETDDTLEVGVVHGSLTLLAVSTEVSTARWQEEVEIEEDEERMVEIQMLEAIAEVRKLERRQSVWRDIKTGKMWQKRDNGADVTWSAALNYCEELELGGFENWRLPGATELESIEAMWSLRPYKTPDSFFLSSCCAWSSTESTDRTAWNQDFRFRRKFEVNRKLSFGLRALCTRDMTPQELADAILLADPKEQKRRLKAKRERQDERKRRKEERQRARQKPNDI